MTAHDSHCRLRQLSRMLSVVFLFFLTTVNSNTCAQSVELVLELARPNEWVLIERFDLDRYHVTDSVRVDKLPQVVKIDADGFRMFRIKYGGFKEIEFPLVSSDDKLVISTTESNWQKGLFTVRGTEETQCWSAVVEAEREFQQRSQVWLTKKYALDKFDPRLISKYDELDSLFSSEILRYNLVLEGISDAYGQTVCGQRLIPNMILPCRLSNASFWKEFDNDLAFWHQHYFDNFNLADTIVLRTPNLRSSLDVYLKNYTTKTDDGVIFFLNQLFSKPMDSKVQQFLLEFYIQTFISQQNEKLISHIMKKAESCESALIDQRSLVNTIKLLEKGFNAPEIVLSSSNGNQRSLRQEIAQNKTRTALVFFSATCPHCERLLVDLTNRWQNEQNKFNVFLVTADEPEVVNLFLLNRKIPFEPSYYSGTSAETDNPFQTYAVLNVPTLVWIDEQGRIINRFGKVDD